MRVAVRGVDVLDGAPVWLRPAQFCLRLRSDRQPARASVRGVGFNRNPTQRKQPLRELTHGGMRLADGFGDLSHRQRATVVEDPQHW
ncbi:MAG: hypothetical protein BWZ07_01773 [Alphaproteobacteria bacterium ADurb.BinA280]|nr:MAG: hypothetical protein BWZ07_01773 [Alphaproteobacteria bacterium ADurb.BinA280]